MRARAEVRSAIEAEWRRRYASVPEPARSTLLAFELDSVEIHRRNLVPFAASHGVGKDSLVLDFGSGSGCSATALAFDLGARVVGVEPFAHNELVSRLWAECYGVSDRVELRFFPDTLHLPFSAGRFDFVVASSCLEYIPGDRGPFLREMVRVLAPGGRLLVAGTSNAVWPYEPHSKTWLVNWMPNLGPRIRGCLGRTPEVERGITFGEIAAAVPNTRFVRGASSEPARFAARLAARLGTGPRARRLIERITSRALDHADRRTRTTVGWPVEALLPWLNVAFEKAR